MWSVPNYNMVKNSDYTLGLYTLKTSKDRKFSKTCSSGGRLVRRRQLEPAFGKRGMCRASSVAGSTDTGAASTRANWPLRHTLWRPSRAGGPRQASLQAWPAAAIDYRQGIHRGPGRGRYLTDFLHAAAPDLGVELKGAQSPSGSARSSGKLRPGGLKGGLRDKAL